MSSHLENLLLYMPIAPNASINILNTTINTNTSTIHYLQEFVIKLPEKIPYFRDQPSLNPEILKQLQIHIKSNIIISGPNNSGRTTLVLDLAKSMNLNYKFVNSIDNINQYTNFNGILIFKNLENLTPQRSEFATETQLQNTTKLLKFLHAANPFYAVCICENANKLDAALRRNGRFGSEILKNQLTLSERIYICQLCGVENQNQIEISNRTVNYTKGELERVCQIFLLNRSVLDAVRQVKHAQTGLEQFEPRVKFETKWHQTEIANLIHNFTPFVKFPEIAKKYDFVPQNVLIMGASGSGKTTLITNFLSTLEIYSLFQFKLQQILSMYVGESEMNLREMFRAARQRAPAVIVIEGIDAIFGDREAKDSNTRLLTALLTELDGARQNDQVFVVATAIEKVDDALTRFGRLGLKVVLGENGAPKEEEILVEGSE
eukprot:EST43365.1 AAA family ATPase, CDC48 subfamily [Spironucleus salmonicida]